MRRGSIAWLFALLLCLASCGGARRCLCGTAERVVETIDSVTYRDLVFLGDADKHGDRERMFYWDMEKPLPAFEKGRTVRLTYYDRFIIGYEAL